MAPATASLCTPKIDTRRPPNNARNFHGFFHGSQPPSFCRPNLLSLVVYALEHEPLWWGYGLAHDRRRRRNAWLDARYHLLGGRPFAYQRALLARDDRTPPFTYFAAPVSGPRLVKIGTARDPEYRLADLQIGSPLKLELLAVWPGLLLPELTLHHRFAHLRQHGEWFRRGRSLDSLLLDITLARWGMRWGR
jgi:hypothetical protein